MKNPSKTPEPQISWRDLVAQSQEPLKCNHYFEFIEGECRCRGCRMGLTGVVDVVNGRPV